MSINKKSYVKSNRVNRYATERTLTAQPDQLQTLSEVHPVCVPLPVWLRGQTAPTRLNYNTSSATSIFFINMLIWPFR